MKKYTTEIHHALTRFKAAGFVVTSVENGERNTRHTWPRTGADIDQAVEQILAYDDSWVSFSDGHTHVAEGYAILGNKPGDLFTESDWTFAGEADNSAEHEFNNLTTEVADEFRAWHAVNELLGINAEVNAALTHMEDQASTIAELKAERDRLDKSVRNMEASRHDLAKRQADTIAELKAELKAAKGVVTGLKAAHGQLTVDYDQLSSDHQAMGVELRQAHKNVNKHTARCTELENLLEAEWSADMGQLGLEEGGHAYHIMVICDLLRGGYQRVEPVEGENLYREMPHEIVWADAKRFYFEWSDATQATAPHYLPDSFPGWLYLIGGYAVPQVSNNDTQPITDAANERLLTSLKHQSTNWQAEAEAYRHAYNTLLNRIEPTITKVRDRLTDDLRKLWNQS
jgi:hypothetical protein